MSLLLTSFATWKAHQITNASDDLVGLLQTRQQLPVNTLVIRHLPVHFQLAPCQVLSAIVKQRPTIVVCCGMAEQRSLLNLERYAHHQSQRLETSVNLQQLCQETQWTAVSHDAGNYVCNDLYFRLLTYIKNHRSPIRCLFIHVPPLTPYNREPIIHDVTMILSRLVTADRQPDSQVAGGNEWTIEEPTAPFCRGESFEINRNNRNQKLVSDC